MDEDHDDQLFPHYIASRIRVLQVSNNTVELIDAVKLVCCFIKETHPPHHELARLLIRLVSEPEQQHLQELSSRLDLALGEAEIKNSVIHCRAGEIRWYVCQKNMP